jgi:hypothetical protein
VATLLLLASLLLLVPLLFMAPPLLLRVSLQGFDIPVLTDIYERFF